jgi:ubiquinone/menaquinone biosynthesis C-methylase UbiE
MWTPSDLLQWQDQHLIDPACGAELMRQSRLHQLLSLHLAGALLPSGYDVNGMQRMLDLACGPGDWALDLASAGSEREVIGIDVCPAAIAHARMQAHALGLENISFEVMNVLRPWQMPEASFDFLNGRFLNACLQPHAWPEVLEQCRRALRPGGIIRLTECLAGESSSSACEQLSLSYASALCKQGLRCTPAGRSHSSREEVPLDVLLKQAGFQAIQQQRLELNFSVGTAAHSPIVEQTRIFFQLLKPCLLRWTELKEAAYEQMFCRAYMELLDDSFSGSWEFIVIWAQTPAERLSEGAASRPGHKSALSETMAWGEQPGPQR